MDEDDIDEVHPVFLAGQASALARRHGLDAVRVRRVFCRLLEVGWLAPKFPWNTALDEALWFLSPEDALRLFEEGDLLELARRVALFEYLAHEFAPLYTRGELAGLARDFAAHLARNREYLLLTGHPKTNFVRSPFLDWHLTRLNFTKLPLTVQGGRDAFSQKSAEEHGVAETDDLGNVVYSYTWAEQPAESLGGRTFTDLGDGHAIVSLPDYSWFLGRPTNLRGEPVDCCRYEEAALAPDLRPEDAARLEDMRERMLAVRMSVVRTLSGAAAVQDAAHLERDCFAAVAGTLTYDDAQFLLSMDEFYEGLHGTNGIAWSPVRSLAFHNGGLGDLLDVIGHFGKEVAVGTMHWTALSLRTAMGGSRVPSYYGVVGSDARPAVDALLDRFQGLEAAGKAYLSEYRTRANDLLQDRLSEEVTVSLRVARGQSRQFRSMLGSFADFLRSHVEMTGEFPRLSLSSPEPDLLPTESALQPSAITDAVLVIREASYQVHFCGKPLSITPRVLTVLALLARQVVEGGGGWVRRDVIYDTLFSPSGDEPRVYLQQVDDTVKELRRALDAVEPGSGRRLVETKRRVGYRLSLSPSDIALL